MGEIFIKDIVEGNGKTIKDNNLEKVHDIPIGSLVEVIFDKWYGWGACEKSHARLWVVSHDRDFDGTPLYSLSQNRHALFEDGSLKYRGEDGCWVGKSMILNIANDIRSGFGQESLTVIKITEDLINGFGALSWDDGE